MKEKITFPQLVELVAKKADTTNQMSELFLQELFATVTQVISKGQIVKIKGIGTFKLRKGTNLNGDNQDVEFIPDKSLAEAVNAPFSQFKAVELCDDLTEEKLAEIDTSMEPKDESSKEEQPIELEQQPETPKIESNNDDTKNEVEATEQQEIVVNVSNNETPKETSALNIQGQQPRKKSLLKQLLIGAAAIAAIVLITLPILRSKEKQHESSNLTAKTDTVVSKPAPVVTDTLSGNNGLFHMSKKHYGDEAFWAYIARENQKQYPDYHKIPNGAIIIIPEASKYGINSDSKESLRKAGDEAMKLYKEIKALNAKEGAKMETEGENTSPISKSNFSSKSTKTKKLNSSKYHKKASTRYNSGKKKYRKRSYRRK